MTPHMMVVALPALLQLGPAFAAASSPAPCADDDGCSLNGLCTAGKCDCDAPWIGTRCQTLQLAPGIVGLHGLPLCAYHGDGPNSTSWGGSVLHAPEDNKYYMWVASMVNNCTLNDWMTNSEVVLAVSNTPLGPFSKVKTIVPPWAHNPQTIRAPDNSSKSGHVYALFTLGDGQNYHGSPKNCGKAPPAPPTPPAPPGAGWSKGPCNPPVPGSGGCMAEPANFTIYWSETADGEYHKHTAQILNWPTHSRGRPWDYGAFGNWNPAPLVHPNGTIYLLDHTGQLGWKHGEAIITAESWRGPYRLLVSDSDTARWKGTTENAEDPFMWIDKRGHWHQLVEGNPTPGGHAWSKDGFSWSNISGANGLAPYRLDGPFNLSRPYKAPNGSIVNASYYTPRPKLMLSADGTPTHLYNSAGPGKGQGPGSFTVAQPLGAGTAGV